MKKIYSIFIGAFLALGVSVCSADSSSMQEQNLRIFSVDNSKGAINAKSIEKAFNASGVKVDVNNDMNSIFSKRYGFVHHKAYNLAIFTNEKLVLKLMKKYPNIGFITPLSMSIYENAANKTINISTLSLHGMARITKIPVTNPDLIAYAASVDAALHKALPNGKYVPVSHNVKPSDKPLTTEFTKEFELEEGTTYTDAKTAFEEEFEGELGPVGFLIPKSYNLQHDDYDFFDTYSIIRFNAIFPVSKNHPDAGAFAPFSLVIYKKKDEETAHIGFPSIDNWISDLDISDEESIKAVNETQGKIKKILTELTE
ncbi:hypothetical protein containing DUF302 [Sulfurimonas gotlandica GD1]|uniref:DUF302 domain-containing protein n=1 Tax=Sulfurimonas gotlandica (strain DSM 19862 / JCM 16533 / GD1) TaxID=929558 RepID=B6BLR5_SULGG|nr:hypothetical protein [Sulfurimonas gotlandica]EDZ62162.1 conserved hypothetical protein [Sulfurimonas gotlandica GD1]EHP28725.1 hypothetical protein containing DUF302 [Sulfurimonas gotlandica GD1]